MPPLSSLAGILDSSVASSSGSTVVGRSGQTLPDISLGSLGSSFHSDDGEGEHEARAPASSRANRRSLHSPLTPLASAPASALVSVSPSSTRRTGSSGAGEGSHAPRRSRYLRHDNSEMDETLGGGGSTRLSNTELVSEDDDGVLGQLSVSVTHRRTADLRGSASAASAASSSIYGSTSTKRSGRHSVAAGGNPMTLREQEQNVDALQKENFNLQLENHFLKERLASMAPDHIEAALKENVKLKIEILNLSKELKKAKKLLSQQDRDLNAAARERGNHSLDSRQLEAMYRDEKDRVATLAVDLDDKTTRIQQLEEELDAATGKLQDQEIELFNLNEELDKVKGLGESVSISKGREARLVQKLEEENDELKQEAREFEDRNNDLRDQLASAQIEIDQLNNEMDAKVDAHEREIQQVESEWREEVIEARAQVEEFKGTVQERDNIVVELEEELGAMRDRNEELLQREELIADQLEEVQKKFDNDNATRETDLQDANREIQDLGQRCYDLEEEIAGLNNVLDQADAERQHFEDVITALKEARRKVLDERDEFSERHQRGEEARQAELVAWEKDRAADSDKHRRELGNRDQVAERLATELEAAREHVARRNEDLALVQNQLRDIEDQHRKLGDETVSGQRSLELEIASLRRDLTQYEADLARARGELQAREQDLQARDLEVSNLIDTNREMDGMLATERKGRLTLSDKLDQRDKTVRQQERELGHLRDKLSSTEPRLSEMQSARSAAQRDTDRQKNELSDLLVTVLKDLNRFLGVDESGSTNVSIDNFRSFRTTLEQRLRSMKSTRADLERRVKESEGRMEQKLASLKRQLDTRWRVLDSFEASVKKLETQKAQWRDRLAQKDAELVRVRGQTREPAQPDVSAEQLKQLTERAQAAEARAKSATKAVTSLEERLAEIKKSSGTAEIKWEARVKEYESRMRQAEEKIKAGRQGGSERVRQLEAEARELKRQIDNLKNYNRRAEDVVARADK